MIPVWSWSSQPSLGRNAAIGNAHKSCVLAFTGENIQQTVEASPNSWMGPNCCQNLDSRTPIERLKSASIFLMQARCMYATMNCHGLMEARCVHASAAQMVALPL